MHSTLIDLQPFDLLVVDGEDSKKFLQGQLSCNIDELTINQSLTGILYNIKGRTIAEFRIFEYQQTNFLQLNAAMAEIVKPVLDKYIVFSKAEINIVDKRFSRFGLIGNDAHKLLQEAYDEYPLNDGAVVIKGTTLLIKIAGVVPRYEIWQELDSDSDSNKAFSILSEHSHKADISAWDIEDINAGISHITPAMTEQYLPEALNYDISGAIDFKKGCYTGQEIVARMYYRGTAKKRLFHLYLGHQQTAPEIFTVVNHQHQHKIADNEIIKVATTQAGEHHLLAILSTDALANEAPFYLNNQPDLLLELRALTYQA